MTNDVGPNTSHRQGYKMASARAKTSLREMKGQIRENSHNLARDRSLQSTKGKCRLMIKEDLFAIVIEESNFKKSTILWKNEHNFIIILPQKAVLLA